LALIIVGEQANNERSKKVSAHIGDKEKGDSSSKFITKHVDA
jgi:hypothetical protein